jgi:4-aminobutyrate aminotransferase-like enzyme
MPSNAEMLKRAYQILPGNSLGSFYLPEGHEFVIERAAGSKVYDVEGREYLDSGLGSGLRARS